MNFHLSLLQLWMFPALGHWGVTADTGGNRYAGYRQANKSEIWVSFLEKRNYQTGWRFAVNLRSCRRHH
jgi:hypothetical protein